MKKLEQLDSINKRNNGELSINFKENLTNFLKRLDEETSYQITKFVVMNNYPNDYQDNEI